MSKDAGTVDRHVPEEKRARRVDLLAGLSVEYHGGVRHAGFHGVPDAVPVQVVEHEARDNADLNRPAGGTRRARRKRPAAPLEVFRHPDAELIRVAPAVQKKRLQVAQ
jgi:hypothetical protein